MSISKKFITRPTQQIYKNYTSEDFKVWKILFNRQLKNLEGIVADKFIQALENLNFTAEKIPNFIEKMVPKWRPKGLPRDSHEQPNRGPI